MKDDTAAVDVEYFAPAGSPEAVALARAAGIPEAVVHLFSSAGLAAMEQQEREWEERTSRPGSFERYCTTVADSFLAARGLRLTRLAA